MKVSSASPPQPSQPRKWTIHLKAFVETIFIALIMVPNTMYYGSANALSQLLLRTYGDSNIITNSSLMHSVPSIFSAFGVSFFTDVLGVEFMILPLQALILIGCICSALAKSSVVFLIGRFCYGLCGEGLIMVQSKLISNRIPRTWHPFSFALIFCGFMLGESMSSIFIGKMDSIPSAYFIIAACMGVSLLIEAAYTALEVLRRRKEKNADVQGLALSEAFSDSTGVGPQTQIQSQPEASLQHRCKDMFTAVTDCIKTARPLLWLMVVGRILFMGTRMGYDSTSVMFLTNIFGLDNDTVVSAVGVSQISSAISFLLTGFLVSFWQLGPILIILCGHISLMGALMTLYFFKSSDPQQVAKACYLICTFVGISFGFFASNSSAVIVSLSKKAMAASGLGMVFSMQFLIMSGIVPLAMYIAKSISYRTACWVYIGVLLCAVPILLTVFTKLTITYSQIKREKKAAKACNDGGVQLSIIVSSVTNSENDLVEATSSKA